MKPAQLHREPALWQEDDETKSSEEKEAAHEPNKASEEPREDAVNATEAQEEDATG